ncbi:hypothetical protein [Acinetobacter baumannii]|uniref:hypothetical protein n=1 Tax=Acinetobacter baumannii TaxID=470 RepID=UPI00189BBE4B|nr:hypothetical protein [Acinetobacter baumannii]MBF6762480.1 hypothetical protein [Acinetobacter baumannii]MBF6948004.1 hypothetical protein [Acinetobacter baumannii]
MIDLAKQRAALMAQVAEFKKDCMELWFVPELAASYSNRDFFSYSIIEDNQAFFMIEQARQLWSFWNKAKAQAVSETHTHSVTLTCAELKEAYDFGAPDESQEQMTDLVTIGWHEDGHSGAGYYAYMTECEDEGSIKLGESESGAEK